MRELLEKSPLRVIAAFASGVVGAVLTILIPLAVGDLISAMMATGSPELMDIAPLALMALGGSLAGAFSAYLLGSAGEVLVLSIRQRIVKHVLHLPLKKAREFGEGNLVARVTSDTTQLRSVVDIGVAQIPVSTITVGASLIIMGIIDWVLLLIVVVTFAIAALGTGGFVVGIRRSTAQLQEAIGGLAQRFTASLSALPTIKAYCAESKAQDTIDHQAEQARKSATKAIIMQSALSPLLGTGQQFALIAVVIGSGARLVSGDLSIAEFSSFLLYLIQMIAPLTTIATGIGRLQAGLAAKQRIDSVLSTASEPYDEDLLAFDDLGDPPDDAQAIRFENVTLSYQENAVLKNVSFVFPGRGIFALVGPSGAGKTSIINLVENFYAPDRGTVNVFGRSTSDWDLYELRDSIAYVDQEFTQIEGTVRENLTLGQSEPINDTVLMERIAEVGLLDTIECLPEGLDTHLGAGIALSGGERQRLALVRAMLSDAPILLLDEPTSQLDSINEDLFRQVINRLAETRTVVVVAHRLSTVRHAVRIVVLEAGQVIGMGQHEELLRTCPMYAELVRGQMLTGSGGDGMASSPRADLPTRAKSG